MASVEPVLLYGRETWKVRKAMEKKQDGCYTKMLRMVFNVSWQNKLTNKELYGNLLASVIKSGFQKVEASRPLRYTPGGGSI